MEGFIMQNTRLVELAIKGLEAEKARIERELAELRNQGTARAESPRLPAAGPQVPADKRRRKMSAAARRKISEAMKKIHAQRKAAASKK